MRLWHTSCGPLVLSPPPSLTTSVTQTHAKQATVSTASHIQLQMSPLWAPAPFDVMNNEDEFSFTPVCENYNVYCLGPSHQALRSVRSGIYSCPSYIPTQTIQFHMLTGRCCKMNTLISDGTLLLSMIASEFLRIGTFGISSRELFI